MIKKTDIYYQNSLGEKIYLSRQPYMMLADTDLFDYEWEISQSQGIYTSSKSLDAKSLKVSVSGGSKENYHKNLDNIFSIFEKDILLDTPGRLYINGFFMFCFINAKTNSSKFITRFPTTIEFSVMPTDDGWFLEIEKDFSANNEDWVSLYLDFPFDFPFEFYLTQVHTGNISVQSFAKIFPILTIHGRAENPSVQIADKIYGINVTLAENEDLVIDAYNSEFKVISDSSTDKNVFSLRQNNDMLDGFITNAGEYKIYWDGDFDFSLKLICKRGEPSWT